MKAIAHYMTAQPWTVQIDDALALARQMFAEREIHHLPVLQGQQLVGIVTDRDLRLIGDRVGATVEDAMTTPRRVDANDSLEVVVDLMAQHGWDAVVVTSGGRVAGIFTAIDSLRVLLQLLQRRAA